MVKTSYFGQLYMYDESSFFQFYLFVQIEYYIFIVQINQPALQPTHP
jgi:hypothetical protein